jgi:hypothetical protein
VGSESAAKDDEDQVRADKTKTSVKIRRTMFGAGQTVISVQLPPLNQSE